MERRMKLDRYKPKPPKADIVEPPAPTPKRKESDPVWEEAILQAKLDREREHQRRQAMLRESHIARAEAPVPPNPFSGIFDSMHRLPLDAPRDAAPDQTTPVIARVPALEAQRRSEEERRQTRRELQREATRQMEAANTFTVADIGNGQRPLTITGATLYRNTFTILGQEVTQWNADITILIPRAEGIMEIHTNHGGVRVLLLNFMEEEIVVSGFDDWRMEEDTVDGDMQLRINGLNLAPYGNALPKLVGIRNRPRRAR